MWFGTWNGLNRFDGNHFVTFKSSPGDLALLQNDRIDQITEDRYQHLWLKAYDGQIYRFDKKTEQFQPLAAVVQKLLYKGSYKTILCAEGDQVWIETVSSGILVVKQPASDTSGYTLFQQGGGKGCALPSNKIGAFKKDYNAQIWIGTSKGLATLVKDNKGIYHSEAVHFPADTCAITCIAEAINALYFGTSDGRVLQYNKAKKKIIVLTNAGSAIIALLAGRDSRHIYATTTGGDLCATDLLLQQTQHYRQAHAAPLYTIYEDRGGHLWMKPEAQGAVRFDTTRHRFTTYHQQNNANYNYSGDHFKVFEDKAGLLWVNLKGGGFGYYDTATDEIAYFYNNPASPNHRYSNIVNSLYYDPEGLLWLRTDERGLEKITFHRNDFQQHLLNEKSTYLSDNEVRGLVEDSRKRLWVGAKDGTLYVYENGKRVNNLFTNLPPGGLGLVYAMLADRNGAIWLGTKAHGLYKATPLDASASRYQLAHYMADTTHPGSISSNEIYSICEDEKGRIWVGSFENGLNLVTTGADGKLRFIHDNYCLKGYPASTFRKIRHMATDHTGHLWLATTDGLLVMHTADTTKLQYAGYQKISGDSLSLGNNNVQHLYSDARGNMWLSTAGGGLNRAIGKNPLQQLRFEVLTTRHGLPNDFLLSCTEDAQHRLWIATQTGLARYDPVKKTFRNYNSNDGLPPYSFSEASVIRRTNGTLLFGTIKGYLTLDPQQITETPVNTGIAFTRLQVNGAEVQPGGAEGVLPMALNYCKQLTLRHNQNNVSIHYVELDFRSGNERAYAYRLTGFDDNWNTNNTAGSATYTNLPPGKYVFEVKLMNGGLYSRIPVRSIEIVVLPPAWKTWWAYLIYIALAAAAILAFRRVTLTMLRLRQNIALEKKVAAMKQNFFTHVSHELRTPLTLILNPADAIARQESLTPQGKQYVEVIRKNARRMNHFVNQLLQLRKLESGKTSLQLTRVSITAFIQHTSAYFSEKAREKAIEFLVVPGQPSVEAWIDAEKMETVLYNLLANAFKFTPNGRRITVSTRQTKDETIIIEVTDEGCGVPPEKLPRIFDLFYEGDEAKTSGSPGTGIGLSIAKEIVALHQGTIIARNNPSGGLTVHISLPPGHAPAGNTCPATNGAAATPPALLHQPGFALAEELPAPGNALPLILLVEDNPELRSFIKSQLEPWYQVETAENGEAGLEKACLLLPDLVLSDIMMPVMNGIAMLDRIKNNLATSHIPVVLLSARNAVESQIEGMEYGADYYIAKPFQLEFLLAAIRNLIRQRKTLLKKLLEQKPVFTVEPGLPQVTSQDQQFLERLLQVVEEKMSEANFDIDTVAETIGMGRTTFYKKIKGLTGLAPVEFVREMRLKRAQQYMDAGYGNISEIAYSVGFSSAKYFSTCFKTKFQLTPSEYLKQTGMKNTSF